MRERIDRRTSTIRGAFSPIEIAVLSATLRRLPPGWRVYRARCDSGHYRCYARFRGGVIILAANAVALACKIRAVSEHGVQIQPDPSFSLDDHPVRTVNPKGFDFLTENVFSENL